MPDKAATTPPDGTLEPIQASRDQLERAANDLKASLAEPSATKQWRDSVIAGLERTQAALDAHHHTPPGAPGLPSSVVRAAPRLAGQAGRLSDEHADLRKQQKAVTALAHGASAPDDVRDAAAELCAVLLRHVQHAHDLLYDAIESELGGSD
jgi:hypothetical protein